MKPLHQRYPRTRGGFWGAIALFTLLVACAARVPSIAAQIPGTSAPGSVRNADTTRAVDLDGEAQSVAQHDAQARQQQQLDSVRAAVAELQRRLDAMAVSMQRRIDVGSVSTATQADSAPRSAPIRSLADLHENRVPGLVVRTPGAPGNPAPIRLRGLTSVIRANDPIVIVDGVRIRSTPARPQSGNDSAPTTSAFDQIAPDSIKKIEVFRGPAAVRLYGADAANGVIVVTTKRGERKEP